jgi:hypothetical protein
VIDKISDERARQLERRAVDRVRQAGIQASESAIISWVRSVGPGTILAATLRDIRAVAFAF